MKIEDVMERIERGTYPELPVVPLGEPFRNEAGSISNLAWGRFSSATYIKSVAGAVRSNHYHRTDWHFIYVLSGLMQYYYRPRGSTSTPGRVRCPPGTLVFTPPDVEHATFFPLDTSVVTLNRNTRDHASHESDLVRVEPIVTKEACAAVMTGFRCCLPWQHVEGRDFRNPVHAGPHETVDGVQFSF